MATKKKSKPKAKPIVDDVPEEEPKETLELPVEPTPKITIPDPPKAKQEKPKKKAIDLAVIQGEVQKRAGGSMHPMYLTNALNSVLKDMGISMEEYQEARRKR